MAICYNSTIIPNYPLVNLTVSVHLIDRDGNLPEYPTPNPKVYARYDSVPYTDLYDYKIDMKHDKEQNII